MNRHLKALWMLPLVAGIWSGCSKTTSNSFGAIDGSLISLPSTGGVIQSTGFYVKALSSTDYPATTYLHKFGDFNTRCEIPSGTTGSDIQCILNIREQDLHYWGLKFEVNIPRSMCKFYVRRPYYYYNFETGYGPSVVNMTFDTRAGTIGEVTSCSYDGNAGTISADRQSCTLGSEASVVAYGSPSCTYNWSNTDSRYPNCCLGKYIYNFAVIDTTGAASVSQTSGTWGGNVGTCLSGPATQDNWTVKTSDGRPRFAVSDVVDGVNEYFEIKTTRAGNRRASNVYAANMYDWVDYADGDTYGDMTVPEAIQPGTDRSGTAVENAQESYEFRCLDESAEVLNRIRVYVNEWDTNEDFTNYVSTSGDLAASDPNSTGQDGNDCAVGSSVTGNCNDYYDWDNMGSSYPSEISE